MRNIHGRAWWLVVLVVAASGAGLLVETAAAGAPVVLPRPGQVGLSVGGSFGTLLDNGTIGEQFGNGFGMNVRLRYRARYERGFGFTFESHSLDLRDIATVDDYWTSGNDAYPPDSSVAYKKATLFLYGLDFYQMFDTRTRTPKMLSVGAGLAHPAFTLNDGETQYPLNDGPYVAVGGTIERFFWQSMAFDFTARYAAIFIGSKVSHDFHASLGIIYYASL